MSKSGKCSRCGRHAADVKCIDVYVEDELRPIQTKLYRMLDNGTLPKRTRQELCEAGDALGRAMQAARDAMPNTTGQRTEDRK